MTKVPDLPLPVIQDIGTAMAILFPIDYVTYVLLLIIHKNCSLP